MQVTATVPRYMMVMSRQPEIVNTVRLNSIPLVRKLVYFVFNNDIIFANSMYPGTEIEDLLLQPYGITCSDAIDQDVLILRKY